MQPQAQKTDELVRDMLGFLESSEEEEKSGDADNDDCKIFDSACDKTSIDDGSDEQEDEEDDESDILLSTRKDSKGAVVLETKKIQSQFLLWRECTGEPTSAGGTELEPKKLTNTPVWDGTVTKNDDLPDWHAKLESNCRRSSRNSYVHKVNRVIYGDTSGEPEFGSDEYFKMAQDYAINDKDFFDFPEELSPVLDEKAAGQGDASLTTAPFTTSDGSAYASSTINTSPEQSSTFSCTNFSKPSMTTTTAAMAAAAAIHPYYQICNGFQTTNVRPASCSSAYGVFLGNKITYVGAAPTAPHLLYNHHCSTATNFISNAALAASSPAIVYSNPMLTTTTQQYLNTFLKETHYLSCGAQGTTVSATAATAAATTGIYERLVYAQLLQQQLYHQTQQQQAAAVAAMFQQYKTPRPQSRLPNGAGMINTMMATALSGLSLCGRQATIAATHQNTLITPLTGLPNNAVFGVGCDDSGLCD